MDGVEEGIAAAVSVASCRLDRGWGLSRPARPLREDVEASGAPARDQDCGLAEEVCEGTGGIRLRDRREPARLSATGSPGIVHCDRMPRVQMHRTVDLSGEVS